MREIQEEFGVENVKPEKRGEIVFALLKEEMIVLMHTFLATDWDGEPVETEEMQPQWFKINDVPYGDMWSSDKEWLPIILSGKKIKARYTYDHEGGGVMAREIMEVDEL